MMNYFTKLFLLISILISGLSANASQVVDGITFINLSFESKVKMIEEAQIMASKMEDVQNSKEEKKKYYTYLKFLSNLLINSAVAQNKIDENKLCIYAGWISIVVGGKCTHPLKLKDSDFEGQNDRYDDQLIALLKDSQTKALNYDKNALDEACKGSANMMCNPGLFGKHPDSGKPFCVKEGNRNSYNSSFSCLKKVQDFKKDKEKYNKIQQGIIDSVTDSDKVDQSNLIKMFKIYYDVCMCNGDSGVVNKSYAKRMFNSRTCYAWIQQTKNIMDKFNPSTTTCNKMIEPQDKDSNKHMKMGVWLNSAHKNIRDLIIKEAKNSKDLFKITNHSNSVKEDLEWKKSREQAYKNRKEDGMCSADILPVINKPVPTTCSITQKDYDKKSPKTVFFDLIIKAGKDAKGNDIQLSKIPEVTWIGAKVIDVKSPDKASLTIDDKKRIEEVKASFTLNTKKISCAIKKVNYDKYVDKDADNNKGYTITAEIISEEGEDVKLKAIVSKDGNPLKELTKDLVVNWKIKEVIEDEVEDEDKDDTNTDLGVVTEEDDKTAPKKGFKKLASGLETDTTKTENKQVAVATLVVKKGKPIPSNELDISALDEDLDDTKERGIQNTGPVLSPGPTPPNLIKFQNRLFNNVD
jgi:hypothetical protein